MEASRAAKPLRIVVLGGGTGSFVVLSALKTLTTKITAIVNMCDDGGSTGALRDELGVLPPGDARQCLVALSERPEVRDLFNYRFDEGRLAGQSLGNIILSGLELQHGSFEKALEVASKILRIRGRVVPAVLGNHRLVMQDGDERVEGERHIEVRPVNHKDARVWLEPLSTANPKAIEAIMKADIVVMAPGGLYNSLLPIYSVKGITDALKKTAANVIFVAHLVNKPHQTAGWHVVDYVQRLEQAVGAGTIDAVLYNIDKISDELLQKYAAEGEYPVATTRARFAQLSTPAFGARLLSHEHHAQSEADVAIKRTLIRHDSEHLATQILKIHRTHARP